MYLPPTGRSVMPPTRVVAEMLGGERKGPG
jgi:hypothetical protein